MLSETRSFVMVQNTERLEEIAELSGEVAERDEQSKAMATALDISQKEFRADQGTLLTVTVCFLTLLSLSPPPVATLSEKSLRMAHRHHPHCLHRLSPHTEKNHGVKNDADC